MQKVFRIQPVTACQLYVGLFCLCLLLISAFLTIPRVLITAFLVIPRLLITAFLIIHRLISAFLISPRLLITVFLIISRLLITPLFVYCLPGVSYQIPEECQLNLI